MVKTRLAAWGVGKVQDVAMGEHGYNETETRLASVMERNERRGKGAGRNTVWDKRTYSSVGVAEMRRP